jgi:hypothetical protein
MSNGENFIEFYGKKVLEGSFVEKRFTDLSSVDMKKMFDEYESETGKVATNINNKSDFHKWLKTKYNIEESFKEGTKTVKGFKEYLIKTYNIPGYDYVKFLKGLSGDGSDLFIVQYSRVGKKSGKKIYGQDEFKTRQEAERHIKTMVVPKEESYKEIRTSVRTGRNRTSAKSDNG